MGSMLKLRTCSISHPGFFDDYHDITALLIRMDGDLRLDTLN